MAGKSLYCTNQVLETATAISVLTKEICFGKPLSCNHILTSVRNLRNLVMYLVLCLFKMVEQVRILLWDSHSPQVLCFCSYHPVNCQIAVITQFHYLHWEAFEHNMVIFFFWEWEFFLYILLTESFSQIQYVMCIHLTSVICPK